MTPVPDTVSPDGVYLSSVPLFAGRSIYCPDGKPGDANAYEVGKQVYYQDFAHRIEADSGDQSLPDR